MDFERDLIRYDRVRHISVYINKLTFLKEHIHGSFELSYVLEGNGHYTQGSHKCPISPGSLVLTNPYAQHSFASLSEQPLTLLTIQIHNLFIRRYVEVVPRLRFHAEQISHLPKEHHDALVNLLFQTACAYIGTKSSQKFDVIGYATLLMGKLFSYVDYHLEDDPDTSGKELQKHRAQRLISYIDENYRQKITLATLADREGISTTYLSHFFRKTFGVSFQEYLKAQRLEKALVLLHDETISMVDICMNCGFSDTRYLESACRETFGCSIAEYRQRIAKFGYNTPVQGDNLLCQACTQQEATALLKAHVPAEMAAELLS